MAFAHSIGTNAQFSTFTDISVTGNQNTIVLPGDQTNHTIAWNHLARANVKDAAYNSRERDPAHQCLENTRIDVFKSIDGAIDDPEFRICLLSGLAGAGKSSIAYTLCDRLAEQQRLLASFMFSRRRDRCSRLVGFFPTIAYQLACSFESAKNVILKTLAHDPSILEKLARDQCESLFINPLSALTPAQRWTSPKVIVIDAFDECQDTSQLYTLVSVLADALRHSRLPPLIAFLTSRPEGHIRVIFSDSTISPLTRKLFLSHFKVDDDIRLYLQHSFDIVSRRRDRAMVTQQESWPSNNDLNELVAKASGLFIYASTVMKIITASGNPPQTLTRILKRSRSSITYRDLDELYYPVVSSRKDTSGLKLVGLIMHLLAPLSVSELGCFLWEQQEIGFVLEPFSSVLLVPKDNHEPVQIYHTSFRDFLLDKKRSREYVIDSLLCHHDIAQHCLEYLTKMLKRDICGINDPSKLNCEIDDLERRCDDKVNLAMRYCCRHWAQHIAKATPDTKLMHELSVFLKRSFLYWMETLSLIGELGSAIPSLRDAYQWFKDLKNLTRADTDLLELLDDAKRFALQYFDGIEASALHVYYSALLFTPEDTLLRKTYAHELNDLETASIQVTVSRGIEKYWSPCSRVIALTSDVESIILSPDGTLVASASKEDTVKLWDTTTGLNITTLGVTIGQHVCLVSFGPDGAFIVAGYEDGSIGVWEAATARSVINEQLHNKRITSIMFSPNGAYVASASKDATVCLWDVSGGQPGTGRRLELPHQKEVNCIAFSPDSLYTASAGEDQDVLLWNVQGGNVKFSMSGHSGGVSSLAFSPSGNYIASGSVDKTIRVWDSAMGSCLMILKGHRLPITSVVFSKDSAHILSFSTDGMIHRWDADKQWKSICFWSIYRLVKQGLSGDNLDWKLRPIVRVAWYLYRHLHTDPYNHTITTAFSQNTVPFAFSCYSAIFLTSDISVPYTSPLAFVSSGTMSALAISSDGLHIASCTQNTISLWDANLGYKSWNDFMSEFRVQAMDLIASSPDGQYLVVLNTRGIQLTDARSAKVLHVLDGLLAIGHQAFMEDSKTQGLFSPDSSTLAYWFEGDHKIRLISTEKGYWTRKLRQSRLKKRSSGIKVAVFSPNSKIIACGYEDGIIHLWSVSSSHVLATFDEHHQQCITCIKFSPNGDHIIAGSADGTIVYCNIKGNFQALPSLNTRINAVAFSPHGQCEAYISDTDSIWLWQPGSESLHQCFAINNVISLGISQDGTHLFCKTHEPATYMLDTRKTEQSLLKQNCFCDYTGPLRYTLRDGWMFDRERRVCWVPIGCRPNLSYNNFWEKKDGVVMRVANINRIIILTIPLS